MYTISRELPPRSASTLIVLININCEERGEGEKIAAEREKNYDL
jgi:hypothetical protein